MNVDSQTRTTPEIREETRTSEGRMTIDEAEKHFNVSRSTIIKWRNVIALKTALIAQRRYAPA